MDFTSFVVIISGISGLAGFVIAAHIHRKRARKETLVCPAGFQCDTVIYSKYSKFLDIIPIENLGIAYYLVITISYGIFLFIPEWNSEIFSFFILSLTTIAFAFSVYLTYVQAVVLKQWCTWCLISASLCTIIFIAVWLSSDLNIVQFLNNVINYSNPS